VAWSHGSRFDLARQLVEPYAGGTLLDYGCGDGTFIAMVHGLFARARGVDVEPAQIEDCERRLGDLPGVDFRLTAALSSAASDPNDVVTCMEVLEHCLEADRRRILGELARLCAPGGRVVISVPIESGPSVAAKQLVRAVSGLRGQGDYAHRERYTPFEMLRSVLGLAVPRVVFTGTGASGPFSYYGHKGFLWRDVEREAAVRLTVERRVFSPIGPAGALLNSQVWFICTPRP
jgi:SAM-dependent methyltransferase